MTLRKLIKEILIEQIKKEGLDIPKKKWVTIDPESSDFESVKQELYDLVNTAYASLDGGHIKITGKGPESLSKYKFWVVIDHDEDPEIDVAIFAKPKLGTKSGGVGHDGSKESVNLYKQKSAELRSGGAIGKIKNWWGEVSGKSAYALIKRGSPAIEDPEKVAKLLAGNKYEWHGEHPDPDAPEMFKKVKGWYTKDFGKKGKHTKIILGNPEYSI
jgi:hypothetical protein